MKTVISCIEELRLKLEKSRKAGISEAETRVTFINPLVRSLGWDLTDPDQVRLEYPTFGGKFVDYALKRDQKPVLFIEAKRLGDPLTGDKGIVELVGYAANAGVKWCVLTNGCVYKVFCSTEKGAGPEKLLYQVSLDPGESEDMTVHQVAERLWRFSPESMEKGLLDSIAEEIFTTGKVRRVLDELFLDPPSYLVNLIRKRTADEGIKPTQVKNALKRAWSQASQPELPSINGRSGEENKPWTNAELVSYLKDTTPYQRILLAALAQVDEQPATSKTVTFFMNEIAKRKPSERIEKKITGQQIAGARAGLKMRRKPIQKEDIIVSSWSPEERDNVYQIKEQYKHIVADWVKSESLWIKEIMG